MTSHLHREERWQEWIEHYNRLLTESQQLAGTNEYLSVQKYLAAQEVAQIFDKLN